MLCFTLLCRFPPCVAGGAPVPEFVGTAGALAAQGQGVCQKQVGREGNK